MDTIVSIAIKKLDEFLTGEFQFLHGVVDDVKWIKDELRLMQAFLRDAETMQDDDARVHRWISDIRDIAYTIEDVIDTFILEDKGVGTSTMGAVKAFTKKCFCISRNTYLYNVGNKLKKITHRLGGLSYIGTTEEATSVPTNSKLHELRMNISSSDEKHVVGFKDDLASLEKNLLHPEPSRTVISILGMGGLGKSTLARKLYNMNKDKFHSHAWICVSYEWEIEDLLKRIIKSVKAITNDELEKMDYYDMEGYLYNLLKASRYLLVIDDMWHQQVWQSLKRALPENKNGSRIIVTTRIRSVAVFSDMRTYVHELRFLQPDESWELFCKKAFPDENDICPRNFEELGKVMVEKCCGLPLAIIVLGGLLSRKPFVEWQGVNMCFWWDLKNQSVEVSSLLEMSYQDLPPGLQLCFLYLSLFPEDFEIDAVKLIQLWVAEDIIAHEKPGMDLEELAEKYLQELSRRCLIQVVEMKIRTISTCRVHDLLRDLAIDKAADLDFLYVHNEEMNLELPPKASYARRIVIHSGHEAYTSLDHSNKKVRTLAFFCNQSKHEIFLNYIGTKTLMISICKRFKLLKVLELRGAGIAVKEARLWLSEVCGTLIHLKYLGLEDTYIDELPKSIRKLQALQTLYVDNSCKDKPPTILPREICKLKQLRHLIGYLTIRSGIKKKHQTVMSPILFGELTNLRSLRSLDVHEWQTGEADNALNAFVKLQNLKILSVNYSGFDNLSIEPLFNCRKLTELEIYGKIQTPPIDMCQYLTNLKYLSLEKSGLKEDPMPTLELLPNLLVLRIAVFNLNIMTITAKGFPQLEELEFCSSRGVTTMQVEEGAMPNLKLLGLDSMKNYCFPKRFEKIARK